MADVLAHSVLDLLKIDDKAGSSLGRGHILIDKPQPINQDRVDQHNAYLLLTVGTVCMCIVQWSVVVCQHSITCVKL